MEISSEIMKSHQALSSCSVRFLEFAGKHPDLLQRAGFHKIYADERFKYLHLQAWPTFIDKGTKAKFHEAALKVLNLIKRIPERLFAYDPVQMSRSYGIPESECRRMLYGVDNEYLDRLFARGDFIITPSNRLKCIEFNIQATLGGWQRDFMKLHYLDTPAMSQFLKEHQVRLDENGFFDILMDHVLEEALKWSERKGCVDGEINIALVFPVYKEGILPYMKELLKRLCNEILEQKSQAWGGNGNVVGDIIFCGFEQLQVKDGFIIYTGKETTKTKKIHTLIEMLNGKVPDRVMEVVKQGNLLIYNGPVTDLMSNKLNLAFLSQHEHSDMFSAEEKETIRTFIPWTRRIVPGETTYGTGKVRVEDFLFTHRESLVIKYSRSLGGYDVERGRDTSPWGWWLGGPGINSFGVLFISVRRTRVQRTLCGLGLFYFRYPLCRWICTCPAGGKPTGGG